MILFNYDLNNILIWPPAYTSSIETVYVPSYEALIDNYSC